MKNKRDKFYYKGSPSVGVKATDFPHLLDGGSWKCIDGYTPGKLSAKSRMEMYLGWLLALGMVKVDAQCMMMDLYWDCYEELRANGHLRNPEEL
jgi:hypothetical protein